MPEIIVICADADRRRHLAEAVKERLPAGWGGVRDFAVRAEAAAYLKNTPAVASVVLYSLVGASTDERRLPPLRDMFGERTVVVELDRDDPGQALDMVRLGAFNVLHSQPCWDTQNFWLVMSRALARDKPYPVILPVKRPSKKKWGFVSMPFDTTHPSHNDYYFAVCPVMKALKLELARYDDMDKRYAGSDLRSRTATLIEERAVFLLLASTVTEDMAIEVGCAIAYKLQMICLRRHTPNQTLGPLPDLLQGTEEHRYANMIELAMRLFFGLGGTQQDLL